MRVASNQASSDLIHPCAGNEFRRALHEFAGGQYLKTAHVGLDNQRLHVERLIRERIEKSALAA